MTLPSQSARAKSPGRGAFHYRRRRRKLPIPTPVLLVAAVVALVVVGWVLTLTVFPQNPDSGDGTLAAGDTPSDNDAGRSETSGEGAGDSERRTQRTPPGGDDTLLATNQPGGPRSSSRPDDTGRSETERPPVVLTQDLGEALRGAQRESDNPGPVVPSGEDPAPTPSAVPSEAGGSDTDPGSSPSPGGSPGMGDPTPRLSRIAAINDARRALDENDPIRARGLLSDALRSGRLGEADARTIRAELGALNREILFGPRVLPDDPMSDSYRVQPGDALSRIASREGLQVHWRLLQRVNQISDPRRIRVGQSIKVVRGPFHAVVTKSDYRLDVFHGDPDREDQWTYVMSVRVGLGEDNSTPLGEFVIRENSKLENPHWINPRTGERFDADDPENPIGERWLGFRGLGEYEALTGYGLHGTIEPDSIGRDASMGCVRLGDDDVELVYELLVEGASRVTIRP